MNEIVLKNVNNNKVINYYLTCDSAIVGVINTYENIKTKYFCLLHKINRLLLTNGKLEVSEFYLIDKKEMYISILKRIENVYCLKPF